MRLNEVTPPLKEARGAKPQALLDCHQRAVARDA